MYSRKTVEQANGEMSAKAEHRRNSRMWVVTTALVLVIFQLPLGHLVRGENLAAQAGREVIFWALTLILVSYILLIERRPLSSIGLKWPTWKSVVFGLISAVVMVGGSVIIYLVVFPALGLQANEGGLQVLQSMPFWFQTALIVRAAVFEELYYRGFAIERLMEITGFRWLAPLISLAAFTFAHLNYWGWANLIAIAFEGAILTALYLFRRDLASNMIAHFFVNAASFLLL